MSNGRMGTVIGIIDYDAGNMKSVEKALQWLGEEVVVSRDTKVLLQADKVILPGVGAFGEAMEKLHKYGLVDVIKEIVEKKTPLLGICLGLQLLFERSDEAVGVKGLGILPGEIIRIPEKEGIKIPHIGWNDLELSQTSRLFQNIPNNSYVYFVHSYYLQAARQSDVVATTDYSTRIDAAVEHENVFACQFHPEKSGEVGLHILKNFSKL